MNEYVRADKVISFNRTSFELSDKLHNLVPMENYEFLIIVDPLTKLCLIVQLFTTFNKRQICREFKVS